MALYHFSVSQIKRSAGQSALAAAAYRAAERLYSEYYDEISDYTRKGGVLHTEILLPAHAPECFRDRATLWNAVEAAERHPKAQLAYSFDIALQNELSLNENIELARAFVQKEFVDRGMIADLAVHSPDKSGGVPNPHMHVMTTMRSLNPDGSFAPKQRREYVLDASGNRIYAKNKPIYENLNAIHWKSRRDAYAQEHDGELRLFYAARRILKEKLGDKPPTVKVWKEELETLRQSYAEQAPRLIPLRDELLKLSQVQHNVDLLLREREERHHSEISR